MDFIKTIHAGAGYIAIIRSKKDTRSTVCIMDSRFSVCERFVMNPLNNLDAYVVFYYSDYAGIRVHDEKTIFNIERRQLRNYNFDKSLYDYTASQNKENMELYYYVLKPTIAMRYLKMDFKRLLVIRHYKPKSEMIDIWYIVIEFYIIHFDHEYKQIKPESL